MRGRGGWELWGLSGGMDEKKKSLRITRRH